MERLGPAGARGARRGPGAAARTAGARPDHHRGAQGPRVRPAAVHRARGRRQGPAGGRAARAGRPALPRSHRGRQAGAGGAPGVHCVRARARARCAGGRGGLRHSG